MTNTNDGRCDSETYCSGRDERLEEFIFLIHRYPHFYFVLRQLLANPKLLFED